MSIAAQAKSPPAQVYAETKDCHQNKGSDVIDSKNYVNDPRTAGKVSGNQYRKDKCHHE